MCKRNSAVFGFEYNSHILLLAPFLSFFLFLSPSFSFSGITKVPKIENSKNFKNTRKSSNVLYLECLWNFYVTWVSFSFFLLFFPSSLCFSFLLSPFSFSDHCYCTHKTRPSRVLPFTRIDSVYLYAWTCWKFKSLSQNRKFRGKTRVYLLYFYLSDKNICIFYSYYIFISIK